LRRTCAKLCRNNGGDLEQIKFLLGHSSIPTTVSRVRAGYRSSDYRCASQVRKNWHFSHFRFFT
jgi:integrase